MARNPNDYRVLDYIAGHAGTCTVADLIKDGMARFDAVCATARLSNDGLVSARSGTPTFDFTITPLGENARLHDERPQEPSEGAVGQDEQSEDLVAVGQDD